MDNHDLLAHTPSESAEPTIRTREPRIDSYAYEAQEQRDSYLERGKQYAQVADTGNRRPTSRAGNFR